MKVRVAFALVMAMLVSAFGAAAAQNMQGTPDPHGHGDHMSGTPEMQMNNLSMGGFYFTVTNSGDEPDRLVKVESDIAATIEIHNVIMKDGVMSMVPQHDGVEIPADGELVLEPGSYHIMLIGINESLIEGEDFTATLFFENAGEIEVTVPIFMAQPDEDEFGDAVMAGDTLEISGLWARQAPKVDGMATPMASPAATPDN